MNSHTLTPSRSHARPSAFSRLADRFRGHGPVPVADTQERADGTDGASTVWHQAVQDAPRREGPRREARLPEPWWGLTEMDMPPAHDRPYVPDALTAKRLQRPDPGPLADLGACPIFRDTVHAVFARQESARGFRAPAVPWYGRYAGLYRARTGMPVITFGIADALREAHEEAKAAVAADIRARVGRIAADMGYESEAA